MWRDKLIAVRVYKSSEWVRKRHDSNVSYTTWIQELSVTLQVLHCESIETSRGFSDDSARDRLEKMCCHAHGCGTATKRKTLSTLESWHKQTT